LKPLGEKPVFELDDRYLAYLAAKAESWLDDPEKYHLEADLAPAFHAAIARFAVTALATTYPDAFSLSEGPEAVFHNHLLGLSARLDLTTNRVLGVERTRPRLEGGDAVYAGIDFTGVSVFTFLALQTQEDWAVTGVEPESRAEWLRALSISFPNHWRPREKIGRSFAEVHVPVAGIAPLVKAAPALIETMIRKGPWERFAWGVATDTVLNHHPDNPDDPARTLTDYAPASAGAGTWLRIERQTLVGFPEHHGALFTIRTYFTPVSTIARDPDRRAALASAVRGMSPESLAYKGLVKLGPPLLAYLDGDAP
ncbi:MAG: heme-dependent oxidative N-demethylase subunit alpha family protein, partial [Candidatus Sericytochromatia bacterium]